MPIYEFICSHCKRRFKKLVGVVANPSPLECPHCSATEITRQISRFARVRSEDDALDSLADQVENMGDTDDPKVMRRMMREMSSAMGEDMDEDIEQLMEEEASGGEGDAETGAE